MPTARIALGLRGWRQPSPLWGWKASQKSHRETPALRKPTDIQNWRSHAPRTAFCVSGIVLSYLGFDGNIPFPSYTALRPCVGAALVVLASTCGAGAAGMILRTGLLFQASKGLPR